MVPKCSLTGYNPFLQLLGLLFLAIILVIVVIYYLQVYHSSILEKYASASASGSINPTTLQYKNIDNTASIANTQDQTIYPGAFATTSTADTSDTFRLRDCKVYFTNDIEGCDNQQDTPTKTCSYKLDGWQEFDKYTDNNGSTISYPKKIYNPNSTNTSELINSHLTSKCFKEFNNNGSGNAKGFEYIENDLVRYDAKGGTNNGVVDANIFGGKKYTSIQFLNSTNAADNLTKVINSICSIKFNPISTLTGKVFYKFIFNTNNNLASIQKVELNADQTGFAVVQDNALTDFATIGSHGLRFNNDGRLRVFINDAAINANMNIYKFNYLTNICKDAQIKDFKSYLSQNINIDKFVSFNIRTGGSKEVFININNIDLVEQEAKNRFSRRNGNINVNYNKEILEYIIKKRDEAIKDLRDASDRTKRGHERDIEINRGKIADANSLKTNFNNKSFTDIIGLKVNNQKIFNYANGYKNNLLNDMSIPIPSGTEVSVVNTDICLIFKNTDRLDQKSYTLTVPSGKNYVCDILVVGGGGGGGMDMGGGGGGGGVIELNDFTISNGSHNISVGRGGNGAPAGGMNGQPPDHGFTISATQGFNTSFSSYTAIGGGHGGSSYFGYGPNNGYGGNGGSGGGASGYSNGNTGRSGSGTSGQGNNGGGSAGQYYAGGGGGAGQAGGGLSRSAGGAYGGIGRLSNILGNPYYWGGGGGGSSYSTSGGNGGLGGGGGGAVGNTSGGLGYNNGSPGGDGGTYTWAQRPGGNAGEHTGGGGGGGSHYNRNNKGGDGGSGIVIIRIKNILLVPTITFQTTNNYYNLEPVSSSEMPVIIQPSRIQSNILTSFVYLQQGFYRFRADIGINDAVNQNPNIIYAELTIYDESNLVGSQYGCKTVFKYTKYKNGNMPSHLRQYIQIPTNKFYKIAYTYYYLNNTASNISHHFHLYCKYLSSAPQNLEASLPEGTIAWYRFDNNLNNSKIGSRNYNLTALGTPSYPNELYQGRRYINMKDGAVYINSIDLARKSFSISLWMRTKTSRPGYFICQGQSHNGSHYLHIGHRGNNQYLLGFWGNDLECGTETNKRNYPEDIGVWKHIVFIVELETMNTCKRKMYRDGVLISQDSGRPLYVGSGPLYIGYTAFWGIYNDIDVSDFILCNDAMTQDEVTSLYRNPPSVISTATSVSLTNPTNNDTLFTKDYIGDIDTSLNQYLFSGANIHTAYNDTNLTSLFSTISYNNSSSDALKALTIYLDKGGKINNAPIDYFQLNFYENKKVELERKLNGEDDLLTVAIREDKKIINYTNLYKDINTIDYTNAIPIDNLTLKNEASFVSIFGENNEADYITFDKVSNTNSLANPTLPPTVFVEAIK